MRTYRTVVGLGLALIVSLVGTSVAEEATVPFRAGDTVTGTLTRCGEYHVLETQLLRGEVLRLRVVPDTITANAVHARVFGPDGLQITEQTRLRQVGGQLVLGPYRTQSTGLHRVQLTTFAAHGVRYHVSSRVKRQRKRVIRLRGKRDAVTVRGTAGATLTLKARGDAPRLAVTDPKGVRHAWEADSPQMRALLGDGLSLADAGLYRFERLAGTTRLRLTLRTPRARAAQEVTFPPLPVTPPTVGGWYWSGRWVPMRPVTPAGFTDVDPVPNPGPVDPTPPRADTDLNGATAPVRRTELTETSRWNGALSGAGLPLSGVPTLEDVTALGVRADTESGVEYAYVRTVDGLGLVHVRVRFAVDGQNAAAPLAWGGRMSLTWTTSNEANTLVGQWTLAHDEDRDVRVLTGGETWIDVGHRQITSAASSFTLGGSGGWPTGELRWGESDPRTGTRFQRVETHTGAGDVDVQFQNEGQSTGTVRIDLR